jgi:nucleoside-diphosphate-sugar epimerase
MRLLITGGAGFIGARLARTLLARGRLAGETIESLLIADQVAPPPDLAADPRVVAHTGSLLEQCGMLAALPLDGVFHLASAVSAECEIDFELGLRSNLDTTRALLDALRKRSEAGAPPLRLVFSSSAAVFGPDPAVPLPPVVHDDTLPTPQTSYGTQKLLCEYLVADYTRKGYIDGRSARLMTVTVRPGRPNRAASSFFSGIIREPLAGETSLCPVPLDTQHAVSSPARTIDGLIAVYEASREDFGGRTAINLPALNVSVRHMLDALEGVAGAGVRERVKFEPDAGIAAIVAGWPRAASAARAAKLGLQPDKDFASIIRQYIDDCERAPGGAQALQGLKG